MIKTMRKPGKILPAVFVTILLVLALCPAAALADPAGDFDVTGGTLGTDFTYASGVLTFVNPGDYTVSMLTPGATTTDRIYVNDTSSSSTKITLRGVKIDVSGISGACAFYIESFSTVELAIGGLAGSELRSAPGQPGIRASSGVSLTITGASSLTVRGGNSLAGAGSGAGIGGGMNEGGGVVNINMGGNITVYGGDLGAGIGGGVNGSSGTVRVYNGMVITYGGAYGAGIGGGSGGNGGIVAISGGSVSAEGSICGAGIGGGRGGSGGTVTISGGEVIAAGGPGGTGEGGAAGIGGGAGGGDSGSITISGGTVTANGDEDPDGNGGAGIGGGNTGDAQNITISGGTVTATGGANAAAVGAGRWGITGDIYLDPAAGKLLNVYTGAAAPGALFEDSPFGAATLYGDSSNYFHSEVLVSDLRVTGGSEGTDYTYNLTDGGITIITDTAMTVSMAVPGSTTDETIAVASGVNADITLSGVSIDVSGTSGASAFRIADGSTGSVDITLAGDNALLSGNGCAGLQKNGSGAGAGTLTISGSGTLTAAGGSGGAGIGGGSNGSASNIYIAGGTVTATGGSGAAGLGRGSGGSGSNIFIAPEAGYRISVYAGSSAGAATELAGSPFLTQTAYTGTQSYFRSATDRAPDLTVTGGTDGTDYTYIDGALRFVNGGSYTVSGTTTTDTITVAAGIDADITLNNVSIDVGGTPYASAFKIEDNSAGDVNITLNGSNTLISGERCAGLQKSCFSSNGTLTIGGAGSLLARGGDFASGIGGGHDSVQESGCNITILSGTITAVGGNYSAGLGAGLGGECHNITIAGGTVTATGGSNGAGIGTSGWYFGPRDCTDITITGGTVTATGGSDAAGIGGGNSGTCTNVTISGGVVTATGGTSGAGIGSSSYDPGDGLRVGTASNITILGGTVTATGGASGAGLGGGSATAGTNISISPAAGYSIGVNVGLAAPGITLAGSPFTAAAAYTGTYRYFSSLTSGPPTYTIAPIGSQTLTTMPEGFAAGYQETRAITIERTGTGDLANLAVALGGANPGSFVITQPLVTTLNGSVPSTTFTIRAAAGLAEGTYTATVTVSADNMTDVTFSVTQPVTGIITGLPLSYEMFTGGRVTWDAQPDGGTWDWDETFFSATFNSPATFTALRAGTSTITYSFGGGSQSVIVTIRDSGLPFTGQDDTIILALGGTALVLLAGALLLSGKLKRER